MGDALEEGDDERRAGEAMFKRALGVSFRRRDRLASVVRKSLRIQTPGGAAEGSGTSPLSDRYAARGAAAAAAAAPLRDPESGAQELGTALSELPQVTVDAPDDDDDEHAIELAEIVEAPSASSRQRSFFSAV